jgi:tetratricopeptide (TPR) repeat protein
MKIYSNVKFIAGGLALLLLGASCEGDYLAVTPGNQLTAETAIADVAGAQAALHGVYDGLQVSSSYGCEMLTFADLRGGDMQPTARTDSRTSPFYVFNNRTPDNGAATLWSAPYAILNRINNIIAAYNDGKVTDGTAAERNDILGQAYALRGMLHFDITKLFGVPYLKDKSAPGAIIADRVIMASEKLQRATVEQSYQQAVNDLKQAMNLLAEAKARNDGYISYWAAEALLSRVYLYMGDWSSAFTAAQEVIEKGPYSLVPNESYLDSWGQAFTSESVFSLVNLGTDNENRESLAYVSDPKGYGEIVLSTAMLDLLRQDTNDVRYKLVEEDKESQAGWMHKYVGRGDAFTANIPMVRLSELYLIAAEAALKMAPKNQEAADQYLDDIRKRANPNVAFISATANDVMEERRKELVHEGHRFYDVMRLGLTVNRSGGRNFLNVGEAITIGWDEYLCVLPVPRHEINANPNILPTPGYTH